MDDMNSSDTVSLLPYNTGVLSPLVATLHPHLASLASRFMIPSTGNIGSYKMVKLMQPSDSLVKGISEEAE